MDKKSEQEAKVPQTAGHPSGDNKKRREEWQKGLEEGEKARRGEQ